MVGGGCGMVCWGLLGVERIGRVGGLVVGGAPAFLKEGEGDLVFLCWGFLSFFLGVL